MAIALKRLGTIKQIADLYPAFSVPSLRWLIFNGKLNGFTKCVRKIGRRVLIDLEQFEAWVDEQAEGTK